MALREFRIQLKDAMSGEIIQTSGGTCHVAIAGLPDKQTLFDKTGAALTNPLQLTTGFINFFTADTVASVDLYVMAPGGQFLTRTGIVASGPNEILVPTHVKRQRAKIPFSIVDSVAATEKDTGFDLPLSCAVLDRLHGCGLYVTVVDSAKTIDVGTGEVHPAETGGDANGLIAASSVAALKSVLGTNGALFSSNAPALQDTNAAAVSITYTLSSGTTLAKGYILLPYVLL